MAALTREPRQHAAACRWSPPHSNVVSSQESTTVVIMDVDGVVSAVHPRTSAWGDEVEVGVVFGPVLVSPTLTSRLDALHALPGVECWWLTSWTSEMRGGMRAFPGAGWGVLAEPDLQSKDRGWWKLNAVCAWLEGRPDVKSIAWCDDHLRGGRPRAVHKALTGCGVEDVQLEVPRTDVGLTPAQLTRLERWVAARVQ